jgi:hypothetical protein
MPKSLRTIALYGIKCCLPEKRVVLIFVSLNKYEKFVVEKFVTAV